MLNAKSTLVLSIVLASAVNISASQIDGGAVVGSMVGAGVGSAIGSATGGKNGAIIGGGVGGAVGAAVGSKETTTTQTRTVNRDVVYVDREDHHDNGKHKGQYKHHHGRD